jgi:hypothetical protein
MPDRSGAVQLSTNPPVAAPVSRETLLKQIRLLVPGGACQLAIDVRAESKTVTLAGLVGSFYTKQLLYHVCGKWAPGFRVIDATVVASRRRARTA